MRKAAVLSVAIHLGLIAGAWGFMQLEPSVDENGAESVSVEIISMETVSTEPSEMVTASSQTLVSAGAEAEAAEIPEVAEVEAVEPAAVVEPIREAAAAAPVEAAETEDAEVTESAEILSAVVQSTQPVESTVPQVESEAATIVADTVRPSQSDPLEPHRTATISQLTPMPAAQPLPDALAEGAEEVVPVPKPPIVFKQIEVARDKPEQAEKKKPPSKQANLGNAGAADADAAASRKSGGGSGKKDDGGSAAASKYPGQVQARVMRAAKYPSKGRARTGEALVSFTVGAGGEVSRVALARSSGDAVLDNAALAAVNRAAPFPPIPEAAGRSNWSFTVPVYFRK